MLNALTVNDILSPRNNLQLTWMTLKQIKSFKIAPKGIRAPKKRSNYDKKLNLAKPLDVVVDLTRKI